MARTLAVPLRNQLIYHYGPNSSAPNNCGPTSLSMVWEYLTGTFINPDKIHDQITVDGHSDRHTGYMNVRELGWWIENRGQKRWYYRYGQTDSTYLSSIRSEIDKGHPVIILTVFNKATLTGGHFVVAHGYYWKDGVCHYQINDPYGGFRDDYTTSELLRIARPKGKYWLAIDAVRQSAEYPMHPESWSARVGDAAARLRTGPGTRYAIIDTLVPGTLLKFSKYTDEGEHIAGGDPPRRWHYNGRGWIADAVLDQDSFRKLS